MAVGRRKWVRLSAPLRLESGGVLPDVRLAYESWGTLAPDASNGVLVLHGLTGDSHASGSAMPGHPTAGWWEALIGPGRSLDTDRWFVVAPNVLGGCQGSTGPTSATRHGGPWGSRFPAVTIRDQVAAEAAGDPHWRGGDYYEAPAGRGPHRGPYRGPHPGPRRGPDNARRIAHITYRGSAELEERFGRRLERGGPAGGRRGSQSAPASAGDAPALAAAPASAGDARYAVESYLDHHAEKLVHRFDAGSYVVLTEAMNRHDIGRGRGGVDAALRRVRADAFVVGFSSDRLFPPYEQRRIARGLPRCADFSVIESPTGHDGFLLEHEQIGAVLRQALR
ncbi:homoserine O-acetyltransferase family protein [Streptomyces sp. NPDC003032]